MLSKPKLQIGNQNLRNCAYSIPCECDELYVGKTSKLRNIRNKQYEGYVTKGQFEKF